jgi:hypothetical protein
MDRLERFERAGEAVEQHQRGGIGRARHGISHCLQSARAVKPTGVQKNPARTSRSSADGV